MTIIAARRKKYNIKFFVFTASTRYGEWKGAEIADHM